MLAWNSVVAVEIEENKFKIFWMRTHKIYFGQLYMFWGLVDGLHMEQKERIL